MHSFIAFIYVYSVFDLQAGLTYMISLRRREFLYYQGYGVYSAHGRYGKPLALYIPCTNAMGGHWRSIFPARTLWAATGAVYSLLWEATGAVSFTSQRNQSCAKLFINCYFLVTLTRQDSIKKSSDLRRSNIDYE
jgi:hypothetical protein